MYFQYPLETLVRNRATTHQAKFAREACSLFSDSDERLFRPLEQGLVIFAANEDALEEPRMLLRDVYRDTLEIRRPRVRYMPGDPEQEPVMHVRVTARREHAPPLLRELRMRDARILEECSRDRTFIVRAEARLAALLGLPARLDAITGGAAMHSIRLVRYVPVNPDPDRLSRRAA